jgi:hypothetical protein
LIAAAQPATLVIERADQFDARRGELLERVVRRAPWAPRIATYAADATRRGLVRRGFAWRNEYASAP